MRINEVMYDLEGSDSDREWIEVINEGSGPVDIGNFKLFENGSNHSLTLVSGSSVIPAGGVAVIAANATSFSAEHAGFSGTLFDSAFSLSNIGETLGIKNGAGADEDSVAYASSMGAQGTGESLGRSGSTFMPQAPSPGSSEASAPAAQAGASDSATAPPSPSGGVLAESPKITVRASGNRMLIVGASSVMSAQVYGLEGGPIDDARIVWNLGNGEVREGRAVEFLYRYPGRYSASVTGAAGAHAATERFIVEVKEAAVSLRAETDGSLTLLHTEGRDLDLSLWQVERAGVYFRLPQGTVILAGEGIRLPPETTGLPREGEARLLYPSGTEAAGAVPALIRIKEPLPARITLAQPAAVAVVLAQGSGPQQVLPAAKEAQPAVYDLTAERSAPRDRTWAWALGALALSCMGAAGVALIRAQPGHAGPKERMAERTADEEAKTYTIV